MAHRAFCVATAIALLAARSSAAWATVEDVGTPGPAGLEDASGSSEITNKAGARFDQFAFKDLSGDSTSLSVHGKFVPIVGAGLEPSREVQVYPERPVTPFDYSLSEYYYSAAPDAIPSTVNNSDAVETIIQSEFMLNGARDGIMTDPAGATGYWPTIYGSSPFTWSAVTVSPRRLKASCSSDGSTGAVLNCVLVEEALGLPTERGTGTQADYHSGQQNFGSEGAASPELGATTLSQRTAGAAFSMPPIYFSVASEVTLPVFTAVPVLNFTNPSVTSNDPFVSPPPTDGLGDVTKGGAMPSVPELPAPALLAIGLVGIALARRVNLRPSARFG